MGYRGTTILGVERDGKIVIAGDGQVTLEHQIAKSTAKKLRRLYNDQVVVGFAGSPVDGLALIDKLDKMLNKYSGNLTRAAVELVSEWRSDSGFRKLETSIIVANKEQMYIIDGNGDVLEPDGGICSIGSGSVYALAAARALKENTDFSAVEIAKKAMKIAGDICIYTNGNVTMEEL